MARQPALRSSPHHLVNRSKEAHPPMKRIATVLALAALSVLPAACGTEPAKSPTTSGELKKVTFTLNWVPYGEHPAEDRPDPGPVRSAHAQAHHRLQKWAALLWSGPASTAD